tara:strand:- start:488 stop:1354 length:867 start_codon:yes stop_codon:yes gene_type:complete
MPSDETIVGKDNDKVREMTLMPSTIETIDYAFYDWINETVDPFATTNKGWEKVKIRWVSGERSWQVKSDRDIRDGSSRIILPMITLHRNGFQKDPAMKGVAWAHIANANDPKGGARTLTVSRRIEQTKTSKFANATAKRRFNQETFPFNNKKVVYETKTFPIPVYVVGSYTLSIRTEYLQQMNEIIQPLLTETGQINNFFMERDGHRFEGFIQNDISDNSNAVNMGDDSRYYLNTVDIKVLGYLIGKGKNDERPRVTTRENAVEVRIPREHVIYGDINEYLKKGFYRD